MLNAKNLASSAASPWTLRACPSTLHPCSWTKSRTMAPKGKSGEKGGAAKGKGKGKPEAEEKGGKVKPAQQVNVRHILVSSWLVPTWRRWPDRIHSARNSARRKRLLRNWRPGQSLMRSLRSFLRTSLELVGPHLESVIERSANFVLKRWCFGMEVKGWFRP